MDFKAGSPTLPPLDWAPSVNANGFPFDFSGAQEYVHPRRHIDPMPYPYAPIGFQGVGVEALHESYGYWRWDNTAPPPNSFLTGLMNGGTAPAALGGLMSGIGNLPRLFNLKG